MNLYDEIQKEIIQRKETIRSITEIRKHKKILGDFYKAVIRDFTERIIPPKYKIYTGVILDIEGKGDVSKEIDIIIINSEKFFPIFLLSNLIITPPEAVSVVIQVKSELTSNTFKDAIDNLSSVKEIVNIPAILVGFDTGLTWEKIEEYRKPQIDKVVCFSKNNRLLLGQFEEYVDFLKKFLI
jgi:hypothetical protein